MGPSIAPVILCNPGLPLDSTWVGRELPLNAFHPPANRCLVQHPQASDPTFKSWNYLNIQQYGNI
jgi:hypothetical protein